MPVDDYQIGERIKYSDDPERCNGISRDEQCSLKAVEGSKFCAAHGGNLKILSNQKADANRYRLTKWQARMVELSGDGNIKSLRDEIGILRMLMEERLNHCQTNLDLVLHSGPISDLVLKIERLVKSCHDIDKDFENLLDKQQVLQMADRILSILNEEINDSEVMESIQRRLIGIFIRPGSTSAAPGALVQIGGENGKS